MRECKRTDDFVKEFDKIFTPRKYILKKLYVENVYKEINFLRKKSMHTKSVFQDKMLRQNYTFKNDIIHKECDYPVTIVCIKVHNEICSI
jgi:hypothetical protein